MLKLLLFFSLLFSLNPALGVLNESEKPGQINVYLEQNSPYSNFTRDKNAQGVIADYWQQWSRSTGIAVKFHPYLRQDITYLLSENQPALYSGSQADPKALSHLKKQLLFVVSSRFYYPPKQADKITSALAGKKTSITVGGLLAQAQQLPIFYTATNISYKEYPGLLELLLAVYRNDIDAIVFFEGEQTNVGVINWLLSLLLEENSLSAADNKVFAYADEDQSTLLEWVKWGNQLENMQEQLAVMITDASNPVWGLSSGMQASILILIALLLLFLLFSYSKSKKDQQFKDILDSSPYPVAILSIDGQTVYYINEELKSLFAVKEEKDKYVFEEPENQFLLTKFVNKASHKITIEAAPIRLLVDDSFHDIEISAKRIHYKGVSTWLCYLKDVNALLRAERELTEERELLRKVLDSIPEQIAIKSPKGTLIGCNEAWAIANNTTVTKATGRRLFDLLPADLVSKQKQQELVVWGGEKFIDQAWVENKNGELSLINTAKLPLYTDKDTIFALLSVESDVTDLYNLNKKLEDENMQRKETEIALSKQNMLLSTVFDASIDPIGLLDNEGRIIGANNAFAKLMGLNSTDIIGQLQSELLSPERGDWAERQNQEVLESGEPLIFDELIFYEGQKIWFEVCKTPFKDSESNYQGIVIIARDITLRKQTEEKLSYEASDFESKMLHDPLTRIANRRAFDLEFEKLWQEACDDQELLSIVMCDVDFFKAYNDNYGHQKGDQVLRDVGQALSQACEELGCFAARYGGEEFVVIFKGGNATKALKVAEIIREAILDTRIEHLYSSVNTIVTMSMGLASILPSKLNAMPMLLAQADSAMYEAKKQGRDQICVH